MIIKYRAERLDIIIDAEQFDASYERFEVHAATTWPRAGDAIPLGPVTADDNEVAS